MDSSSSLPSERLPIADESLVIQNTTHQESTTSNWASSKWGSRVAGIIVALELAPITNEGSRLALTGVVQASFHDPLLSTFVMGLSTLTFEGGGAIVNADLMDAKMGNTFNKMRDKASNWKILRNIKTNLPIEVGIAATAGTPMAQWARAYSRGELPRNANRRWGLLMSLGTSAYVGALTYEVLEGISHPNPESIFFGSLAIGTFAGAYKWSKNKVKRALNQAESDKIPDNKNPEEN